MYKLRSMLLYSFLVVSMSTFAKDAVVVIQNGLGGYYGDTFARALVEGDAFDKVKAFYVKTNSSNLKSGLDRQAKAIAKKVIDIDPDTVILFYGLGYQIKKLLPDDLKARTKLISLKSDQVKIESFGAKLKKTFNSMGYNYNRIYILQDNSLLSRGAGRYLKATLLDEFNLNFVETRTIISTQDLISTLGELSLKPQGILVNALFMLEDGETGIVKNVEDIKGFLIKTNKKHIDVGLIHSLKNEAVLIRFDSGDIHRFAEGIGSTINAKTLINRRRLDKLGYKHLYLNGLDAWDGVVDYE